jgi:ATP-dependent RNA helicase DDX52/ROK1
LSSESKAISCSFASTPFNLIPFSVRHLILDEADRLLEQGFLPQIEEIIGSCTYPDVRKAVFSATLPAGIEAIAKGFLQDPVRVVVGLKFVFPFNT